MKLRVTTDAPAPKKAKPTKATEYRDEDFMKMDSLHLLASEHGLRIMSYWETAEGTYIEYLKPSLAKEPKLEECRDAIDYDLKVGVWITVCTVRSRHYPSFKDMVLGEIERLKKFL